jgi:hypothetical protein
MKVIFHLATLRLKIALSAVTNWLMLILFPVVLIILITSFFHTTLHGTRVPIVVVDLDHGSYSRQVVEKLESIEVLRVLVLDVNQAQRQVLTNSADCAVVIPQGFQDNIGDGYYPGAIEIYSTPASMATPFVKEVVASQVMRFVSNHAAADWVVDSFLRYQMQGPPDLWQQAWDFTDAQWEPIPLFTISAMELPAFGEGEAASLPDQPLLPTVLLTAAFITMLFSVYVNQWFSEDRDEQLQRRLQLCGVKPLTYFIGNSAAGFLLGCPQMLATFGMLVYAFPTLAKNWPQLLGAFALYVLGCTFLGTAVSCWSKTKKHALMSGSCVAIFSTVLASPLLTWSGKYLLPQYWLVEAGSAANVTALCYLGWIALGLFGFSLVLVRWKYASRN